MLANITSYSHFVLNDKLSYHCYNDNIQIAYQFFDAQKTIKSPTTLCFDFKRLIKVWAGCHVTFADVELAAFLHPKIIGRFPLRISRPYQKRIKWLIVWDKTLFLSFIEGYL